MTKKIAYLVNDNGVDGREPTETLYATWEEADRENLLNSDKAKNWRSKAETIVDIEHARAKALAKLDGLDKLVLGLPNWLEERPERAKKTGGAK